MKKRNYSSGRLLRLPYTSHCLRMSLLKFNLKYQINHSDFLMLQEKLNWRLDIGLGEYILSPLGKIR